MRALAGVVAVVWLVSACDCGTRIVPSPLPEDSGVPDAGGGGGSGGGIASSGCTDGLTNGTETDVDCGGATCVRCDDGRVCAAGSDCFSGVCAAGRCAPRPACSDGQRNGDETDVDCGGPVCPRCMVAQRCIEPNDCLSALCDGGACAPPPNCADGVRNGAETDVDCGGSVCPRCMVGQRCVQPTDCLSARCDGGACAPQPTCADGARNGAETDVDCGGAVCPRCMVAQVCSQASDCLSALCTLLRCAPQPTCADGVRNGAETDVDCGGPICPRCGLGSACAMAADCFSGQCVAMTCRAPATCTDGLKNGVESDVDCGGPFCPPCALNRLCYSASDCASGDCSDRVLESDATWKQMLFAPAGWEAPAFNDQAWAPAFVQELHGSSTVWGTSPPMPPMSRAAWIWYRDSRSQPDNSTVYFRRTFIAPPSAVTMHLSVDDAFTAYLNGAQVSSGFLWYNTVVTPLSTTPGAPYVLAVRAQNTGGPGGLVADLRSAEKTCRGLGDAGVPAFDAGMDAGTPDAGAGDAGFTNAGLRVVLPAIERAMLDEEFPTLVTNTRLHLRDDGAACAGRGAVRSIAKWDVSAVPCIDIASVQVRWVYAHDFNQYSGPPRQVSVHQLYGSWSGATASWANAPLVDSAPWGVVSLDDVPDASIVVPVRLDAGIDGLMLRFVSETCAAPRWPAELDPNPTLEVQCR